MAIDPVNWRTFEQSAPELAQRIKARFDAHVHHVLGTLDSSGAPRVSGTELRIFDSEVWLASLSGAMKVKDLRRDPRCSVHSAPLDAEMVEGDAKLTGRAREITDRGAVEYYLDVVGHPGNADHVALFALDISKAVLTRVDGDRLEVDLWTPARGLTRLEPPQ